VVLVLFYIVLPFEPSVFRDLFFFYKLGQDLQSCPMSRWILSIFCKQYLGFCFPTGTHDIFVRALWIQYRYYQEFYYAHLLLIITAAVLEESWCWENETLEFQVSETDVSDLQFVQSGYILKCILSHNITLVSCTVWSWQLNWLRLRSVTRNSLSTHKPVTLGFPSK